MTKPYTYLIGWSKHNRWYYGVQHKKDCDPTDLWESYFTSSKHVKKFRADHGEPDVIRVCPRRFASAEEACRFETKVLQRIRRSGNWELWLNQAINGHRFGPHSEETRRKISAGTKGRHMVITEEHKRKLSEAMMGHKRQPFTEEHRAKLSAAKKGRKLPDEHKARIKANARKTITEEHKQRIAQAQKERWAARVRLSKAVERSLEPAPQSRPC